MPTQPTNHTTGTLGCSSLLLRDAPLDTALDTLAGLGVTTVDLVSAGPFCRHVDLASDDPGQGDRLAAALRQRGLRLAGLMTVPWAPDALNDFAKIRERCARAAAIARTLDAEVWIVDAGPRLENEPRETGLQRWLRLIEVALAAAAREGVQLCVETPHRGTLGEKLPEAVELIERAQSQDLGVDYDTSHIVLAGSSVAASLDALGSRIRHVALRDAANGEFAPTGKGDYDFAGLFAGLERIGYTGSLMLEPEFEEDVPADERIAETRRSLEYLGGLLVGAPAGV